MQAPIDLEIRAEIDRYVTGERSLSDFREWFTPRSWNVLSLDEPLAELVYQVELRLAEFTNGRWTEGELKALFQPLLEANLGLAGNSRWN